MGWQKVAEVIGTITNEIRLLKDIVIQQQDTIKDLHARLEETQTQMTEELKLVHEQLDAITKSPAINSPVNTSPNLLYADVARTPPNSLPANVVSILSIGTTPLTMTDTLYCTIDTSKVASEEGDRTSVGAVRTAVETAIQTTKDQANWRCRAVTRDAKSANRIRIVCRDKAEQRMIKQVAEAKIAPRVQVLRDELYPIKVNSVNQLAVLDDNREIQAKAAKAFS